MSEPRWGDEPWTPDLTPWSPAGDAVKQSEQATAVDELLERLWSVIVYNDEWHTFDEVIFQLQKATGCSQDKASRIAWEVHSRGRAIAFRGEKEQCQRVATILREIRLQVELDEA